MGNLHYRISREKFEPEPGFEPRTSSQALCHLSCPGSHASSCSNLPLETDATCTSWCGHVMSYNVKFPRHKLWVYFQLIIWFEYHINVKGEVISLVVNKMAHSVMTAPPGKSGIRLKREIWTWAGMRTRTAQMAERRARNPEVRGSNHGSGSSFLLGSCNVNFPRLKLWVCFQLIFSYLTLKLNYATSY